MNSGYIQRKSFSKVPSFTELPHFIEIQRKSFDLFLQANIPPQERKRQGLQEVFTEIFPIQDFTGKLMLEFIDYRLDRPVFSVRECKDRGRTYAAPLFARVRLINRETNEIKEQDVYMGEIPLMTDKGTFVVNGAERVVVTQLIRSPGIFFSKEITPTGKIEYGFKIIPNRGAWLEFGIDPGEVLFVRVDKRRKINAMTLVRALGFAGEEEIVELFDNHPYIQATLERDTTSSPKEAVMEIFRRLRPSEPPTEENTRDFMRYLFFDPRRYDLGEVGRYKLNNKLRLEERIVRIEEFIVAEDIILDHEEQKCLRNQAAIEEDNPSRYEILLRKGDKIGRQLARTIEELDQNYNIGYIHVYNDEDQVIKVFIEREDELELISDDLEGRVVSQDVIQSETGEILLKKGNIITLEALRTLRIHGIENIWVDKGRVLSRADVIGGIRYLLNLLNGVGYDDDIDHLGNRRARPVGELIQNQFRTGLLRVEKVIREKMTIQPDTNSATPQNLINVRPVVAAIKEFLGSSPLSQFMDQINPLSEITHKRRLSALGPGGLSRERAGFEVRDVHYTHYGRMCPIETPEGPNIGLITSLCIYAKINEYGFIVTPYLKVENRHLTNEVRYLSADEEDRYHIAPSDTVIDENGMIRNENVVVRFRSKIVVVESKKVDYIDVSPQQIISASASLIPFLEHNDANRALMGTNMQRQAVPLLVSKPPLIGTGLEYKVAQDSGATVVARNSGLVKQVDSVFIEIEQDDGDIDLYELEKFQRSNQSTCINQKPIVRVGQYVEAGQIIADGPCTSMGEIALGRNVLVAFMPWEGENFEDAILISERLVKEEVFTSIHIEEYEIEARDTKLGPEEITRDIPNLGEDILRNLDEEGIIRVGADVKPGDILVGKVTPKGETELTPEERLLRAIFGEKAREVRDTSLRVPHGEYGKVIDLKVFSRDHDDELAPGVNKLVKVFVAQKRKITVGDKMAGRHGNKGVIARILAEEDMPFLPDGTPVDIVLNPLGVPSRMNIGQILETHLGWVANKERMFISSAPFDGAKESEILEALKNVTISRENRYPVFAFDERISPEFNLLPNGKVILYYGRTGEPFDNEITVGYIYMMKLAHLVETKIHARSTGPYSLVTQQPLGGKAQFGGQRFGEMEVWALEGYGAAYTLQEILTVKSDDIVGRVKAYEAIVKGQNVLKPSVPESFKVLVKELQSLCLDVKVFDSRRKEISIEQMEDADDDIPGLGVNLQGREKK
ncbi:MAG: DNA-directed RNA polymerase subunit beta [Candidatus Atribacteria bacterium]|nr:DNA-directed RNA polymerase subunit beta [Candidatus Atribacteria bacterium]